MHIKKKLPVKYLFLFLLAAAPIFTRISAQVVWEEHNKEVYTFLSRMAQKGLIVFDDNIRPISRKYIADCLDSLSHKNALSTVEKAELVFYSREYGNELSGTVPVAEKRSLFSNDPYKRWRSFSATGKGFLLQADPVFTAATIQGSGKNVTQTSSGVSMWGYAGKHWGFHFFYDDITESGKGFDSTRRNTPLTGIVRKDTATHNSQNYSRFRGSVSYSWNNGSISFGQDNILWGYGENGRIVQSDKPPASPFLRLDYQPLSWLRFNYTNTWLNSAIVDSTRTYRTGNIVYGGYREVFVPKYMASHSIQITPVKGLALSFGESIIYSDRFDAGYLMPVMFFKLYDNIVNRANIHAGSNGQLFFQVSSRNQLPKTHLYGTVFIDEIRIGSLFDDAKSRNQLGFTIGGSVTDVVVPYLTLGLEYTRVNPFVYRNLIPAQDYTSFNYSLGDWMGNNFDRLIYSLRYTPLPRLKCLLRYQSSRKGSAGTLNEQYFQQPQPGFLFGLQNTQQEFFARFSYEWLNDLTFTGYYSGLRVDDKTTGIKTNTSTFSLGFTYGL